MDINKIKGEYLKIKKEYQLLKKEKNELYNQSFAMLATNHAICLFILFYIWDSEKFLLLPPLLDGFLTLSLMLGLPNLIFLIPCIEKEEKIDHEIKQIQTSIQFQNSYDFFHGYYFVHPDAWKIEDGLIKYDIKENLDDQNFMDFLIMNGEKYLMLKGKD